MLIELLTVRSKPDLVEEPEALSVMNAVIYRNVDRKAWEQIAREHQVANLVLILSA